MTRQPQQFQQQPQPGQQLQTGQQQPGTGQQHQMMGGMQAGGRLPQQTRSALQEVAQAVAVCGWCADQCIQEADPAMIECIRLCEDVVELGETVMALAPRQSRQTSTIVQAFQQAAQACAAECGQHHHDHCQECAIVLEQTVNATQQLAQQSGQTGSF